MVFADNRPPVRVSEVELHNAYIYKMECVITAVLSYIWKPLQQSTFSHFFFFYISQKKVSLIYESFYETIFFF